MESHEEQIIELPSVATCVGNSESYKYEILMYGDVILSVQGHSEFTHCVKSVQIRSFFIQ